VPLLHSASKLLLALASLLSAALESLITTHLWAGNSPCHSTHRLRCSRPGPRQDITIRKIRLNLRLLRIRMCLPGPAIRHQVLQSAPNIPTIGVTRPLPASTSQPGKAHPTKLAAEDRAILRTSSTPCLRAVTRGLLVASARDRLVSKTEDSRRGESYSTLNICFELPYRFVGTRILGTAYRRSTLDVPHR